MASCHYCGATAAACDVSHNGEWHCPSATPRDGANSCGLNVARVPRDRSIRQSVNAAVHQFLNGLLISCAATVMCIGSRRADMKPIAYGCDGALYYTVALDERVAAASCSVCGFRIRMTCDRWQIDEKRRRPTGVARFRRLEARKRTDCVYGGVSLVWSR